MWNKFTPIVRGLIVLSMCLLLTVAAGPAASVYAEEGGATPDLLWGPYITGTTGNSTVINWKTTQETGGSVQYAEENFYNQQGTYDHETALTSSAFHHVQLSGLQPETVYHYRVRAEGNYTSDHVFRTSGGESFTFVVYGDSQEELPFYTQLDRHKLVADRIAQEQNLAFVLHSGDIVGQASDLTEWDRFFQAAGSMLGNTTIYTVRGNHDTNAALYYEVFGVPAWYSFDWGSAHFDMLDSNNWADTTAETQWLINDLTLSDGANWKFAVFHHPMYTSSEKNWGGWTNLRSYWEGAFIDSGVDAVFSGHVHAYERLIENDIQYIVSGMGGGPSYTLAEEKIPGYQDSLEFALGYTRVTIDGDRATLEVIRVADISQTGGGVTYIYPPNTVFETVILERMQPASASLTLSANVVMSSIGISLDKDNIDYGDIKPGHSSAEQAVVVTNTGTEAVNVTLEVDGADVTAQTFYEQSLYIDDVLYARARVIAAIPEQGSDTVNTVMKVPPDWNAMGRQTATFIFWADAQ